MNSKDGAQMVAVRVDTKQDELERFGAREAVKSLQKLVFY
jgi:hypothetical protein